MKMLGILCVISGGILGFCRYQEDKKLPITVAQRLMTDLEQMRYEVCALRRPLPCILEHTLRASPLWELFWGELLRLLQKGDKTLGECWQQAARNLPPALGSLVQPLGGMLSVGGDDFARVLEELREQLAQFLQREQEQQALSKRLAAAVCFSGAGLLILVCL